MRLEHQGICYSGYRAGQSPADGHLPSPAQVEEDLRLLAKRWKHLRLYDAGPHAELVLSTIERLGLDFDVLLGAWLNAEVNNPSCPWGAWYSDEQLATNRALNDAEVERALELAGRYPSLVTALAAGNEATVEWTGQLVPVQRVIEVARRLKTAGLPVTKCENHVPWMGHLDPLAEELDILSLHSYPVWEYRTVHEAMDVTIADWMRVRERFPDKQVMITEAGWTTHSNGRGIEPWNAGVDQQVHYIEALTAWGEAEGVRIYLFEAFDEPWKGSDDPGEPEKHWGLFTEDRRPKPVMHPYFAEIR